MTLRVLNVNDTIDLKTGGGTAERTFQMSRFLVKQGVECSVLTIDKGTFDEQTFAALKPFKLESLSCIWKRFNFPKIDWRLVRKLVNEADIIHLMGHWSILNVLVYFAARKAGKPYVVCPAGALPLFGRSFLLKQIYNLVIGKTIIRNASAWIAVTSIEFPYFEAYGIPSSQITVIPNGVSEDDFLPQDTKEYLNRRELPDAPIILFMGRLNLIKGPDLLLQAFIQMRRSLPGFHLVFAGPDGGMLPQLRSMVERAGITEQVHFLGYVSGDDKSATYRSAKLLVVPSRQEAMSIVALEAGICGTPVLLTDQCGFSEVCLLDARLEVEASISGLAKGLKNLLSEQELLEDLAPIWRAYVTKHYEWDIIVTSYIEIYKDILEQRHAE